MWWLSDHERFVREQDEIGALAGACDWLVRAEWAVGEGATLKLEFDFKVGERTYEAFLVYPAMFPEVPAYVTPRKPGETWSGHQYGGADGVLCLQWGPDNWQTSITGAMLVRSTYDLIAGEAGGGGEERLVPTRHYLTIGQRTRNAKWRMVLTHGLQGAIAAIPDAVQWRGKFTSTKHTAEWVHFCVEILDGETKAYEETALPAALKTSGLIRVYQDDGWVFKSSGFDFSKIASTPDEVLAQIHAAGFSGFAWPSSAVPGDYASYVVMLAKTATDVCSYYVVLAGDKSWVESLASIEAQPPNTNRLPADNAQLSEKTVGIVGLGSVGTKSAKSLVRQGIRKLVLIEDDVFLPENITRNDLDWLYVGIGKAEALKEALSLIAADVEVEIHTLRVAGQENSRLASTTLDMLAKCNLIVDATANPKVFNYLARAAHQHKIPMVWGEVFAGGIGSLMARSRPGVDPSPLSTRTQILKYLEGLPKAPFQLAENYDADADDGTPLVASDGEVGQFAYTLTRFVIDSLRDSAKQEFPHSAYLIGFKAEWIFTAPFDTQPIQTTIIPALEPEKKPPDEATTARWRASLMKLFKLEDADVKDPA